MMSIGHLAFPYIQTLDTPIVLNKIIFTDEEDLLRLVCLLSEDTNRKCTDIYFIDTKTNTKSPELVNYIQNPSYTNSPPSTPLLLSVRPIKNRMKFSISIKSQHLRENKQKKALIISKTLADDDEIPILKKDLENSNFTSSVREMSKLPYSNLPDPLESTMEVWHRIVVNDNFKRTKFMHNRLNISIWELDLESNVYTHLFSTKVWINDEVMTPLSPTYATTKSEELPKSPILDEKSTVKFSNIKDFTSFKLDDGPEFRNKISSCEHTLIRYKGMCETLYDALKNLEKISEKLTFYKQKFLEIILTLAKSHSFYPILCELNFPKDIEKAINTLFEPFIYKLNFILKNVFDTKIVSKLISQLSSVTSDDKNSQSLENKKKGFENQSKDYYNWLNKYLTNEKDRPESKLFTKKKAFELSKFHYIDYFYNLVNSQYYMQLQENLFRLLNLDSVSQTWKIDSPKNFNSIAMAHKYESFSIFISRFNTEKLLFSQKIEASSSLNELTDVVKNNINIQAVDESGVVEFNNPTINSLFPNSGTLPSVTANPQESEAQISEKEGILYTLGGKGKPGWHKEWVVLNDGQLREFADWRKGSNPVNKAIDIALSNVKSVTKDRRKYCFEITALGSKHVFQAVNERERDDWIKALYNAGQHVDTDRIKANNFTTQKKKKISSSLKKPIKTNFEPHNDSTSPISIIANSPLSTVDYIKQARSDPTFENNICADCGSTEAVEWISLTFLTIFCLKCSSAHRSLGSHISRIKSLKLDNFKDEIEFLIKFANNAKINAYLEMNLPAGQKLNADSTDESRNEYIKNKYLKKLYCSKIDSEALDSKLISSIQSIDISNVLECLICGADVDMHLSMNFPNGHENIKITLIEYSLRKFVVINENPPRKLFVITEMLILRGAKVENVGKIRDELGLTEEAKEYWIQRFSRLQGNGR